jgi:hypothetical protein
LTEIPFVDPSERSKEVPQSRPDPFHGVTMDLSNAITVVISCPLSVSGSMANRRMRASGFRQVTVSLPLVGVHLGGGGRLSRDERLQGLPVAVATDFQTDLPALSSHDASDRWPVVVPRAMSPNLVGSATGRIEGIGVTLPFLSRVLIQLVRFGDFIRERGSKGGKAAPRTLGSDDGVPEDFLGRSPTLGPASGWGPLERSLVGSARSPSTSNDFP